MKALTLRNLCIITATATGLFSLLPGGPVYLVFIATAIFVMVALTRKGSDDSLIFILATGEILVIVVAAVSFWAGVLVQCAVIGAVLAGGRVPADSRDRSVFVLYCIVALVGAIIFDRSNQVLVPFLAGTAAVAATAFIMTGVQEMRERRLYTGGK